jgi:hypothetical protein
VFSISLANPAPASLSGFTYNTTAGGPSAQQSFVVSATISQPLGIKAPSDYEISLSSNGTGFTDSLTLSPLMNINKDSVPNTTIM